MLAVYHDRHAGETCGEQSFEQGAPGVSMHNVRAFAAEQPVQIPHQPWIVSCAPLQLEEGHLRREHRCQFSCSLCAADGAANSARVEPIDELQDPEFHPTGMKREDDVHDAQGRPRGGVFVGGHLCCTNLDRTSKASANLRRGMRDGTTLLAERNPDTASPHPTIDR